MKLIAFLLYTHVSILAYAQADSLVPEVDAYLIVKKDTVNLVDSLGKRQGKWILLGADLPESGVLADSKAEEGCYFNNQKIGPWKRFNKEGNKVIALVYYKFNPTGTTAIREAIFPNKYHSNGNRSLFHYPGKCPNKANIIRFDEQETILELTEFDSLGNEMIIITRMEQNAMDELSYFNVAENFSKLTEQNKDLIEQFDFKGLNGTYVIDLHHKIFQLGEFKNGTLWNGKQCELDDVMNLLEARIVVNGVYMYSYRSPIKGMN